MKKYVLILVFVAILSPYVWAQTIQRGDIMPGFFVPAGALNTSNKAEKLPPIESMTRQIGRANTYTKVQQKKQKLIEQENKEKEKLAETKSLEKPDLSTAANEKVATVNSQTNSFLPAQYTKSSTTETQKALPMQPASNDNIATVALPPQNIENQEKIVTAETSEPIAPTTVVTTKEKTLTPQAPISEENNTKEIAENNSAKSENIQETADNDLQMIFNEYQRDIKDISNNKPIYNKRLEQILSDYKDEIHLL